MKIGIMSMQRIKNYGSYLQAYGLKKVLENLGAEVEFVDYKTEAAVTDRGGFRSTSLCRKLGRSWGKKKMMTARQSEEQEKKKRVFKKKYKV